MDKTAIRNFIVWLDSASLDEIEVRRQDFLKSKSKVSSRAGREDIRLGLRLIDEEVLARLEFDRLPSRKK